MAGEWRDITLGDFVSLQRGHDLTEPDRRPGSVPVVGSAGHNGFHDTALCKGPGIVIGRSGASFGQVHFSPVDFWPHNTGLYVTDFKGNDQRFAFYFLKALDFDRYNSGSAQPSLNRNFIYPIPVRVPPPAEQKAIAAVLGALDDKIELNRRMNATLEAMARALFQSWFVDFDPVRAKLDGRKPDGLDKPTAALFPAAFQESPIGPIPKGWATLPLYDLATYVNGAAYTAFQPNGEGRGLPIIKIAELKAGVTDQTKYSDVQMPEKYRLRTGDILFSWSGNPDTSIDTFVWSHGAAWLNQHIFRVDPHHDEERSFVLATLKYLRPVFAEIARNKQTTGLGHVTAGDMQRLLIVKPDAPVLSAWDHQADPLFGAIFRNTMEAQTLAAIRDTFLPKLLSGELEPAI